MKRRRRRHVRTVILSCLVVGLFLLLSGLFYEGLLEALPALSEKKGEAAGEPLPAASLVIVEEDEPQSAKPETEPAPSRPQAGAEGTSPEPAPSSQPPQEVVQKPEEPAPSSMPQETPPASSQGESSVPAEQDPPQPNGPQTGEGQGSVPGDPYPHLYIEKPEYTAHTPGDKVAYLTFDDGPSHLTLPLLDVLDQYNIKATFFVVGKTSPEDKLALQETVRRGHTLAVHSYTHDYKKIYASPEAFLEDFDKERALIYEATGVEPTIYRYAGGSVNGYNKNTARAIIDEMNRRGYTYYDWNVDSGDAAGSKGKEIYQNVVSQSKNLEKAVILFHNTSAKQDTLDQLPGIIEALQGMGFRFDKLDPTVEPVTFRVPQ